WLSWRVLLAFAGNPREHAVSRVAGHVEVVRVRTEIEQQPGDWQGVFDRGRVREPGVGQVKDWRPATRAAALTRQLRLRGQDAAHGLELAAHESGVQVLVGDRRFVSEQTARGAVVPAMRVPAVDFVVPAREL